MGDRHPVGNRAFVWGTVFGVLTTVVLFPAHTWSFIDGGPETWTRTVIGWSYRVPEGMSDWFPDAAAIVAGILVGLLVWSVVLFVNRPRGTRASVP